MQGGRNKFLRDALRFIIPEIVSTDWIAFSISYEFLLWLRNESNDRITVTGSRLINRGPRHVVARDIAFRFITMGSVHN